MNNTGTKEGRIMK